MAFPSWNISIVPYPSTPQLHYGDPPIRRAVPLALALLSTSNPKLPVLDMLHKFSHDSDPTVARNAVFSMGIVGCGTNNARLAGMLRNLAQFYHKEPQDLFMVRLAQVGGVCVCGVWAVCGVGGVCVCENRGFVGLYYKLPQ